MEYSDHAKLPGIVEIKLSVSLRREKTIPYVAISYKILICKCTHIQENIQHENAAIRKVLIIAIPMIQDLVQ